LAAKAANAADAGTFHTIKKEKRNEHKTSRVIRQKF
jgi:hypothetical protein